MMIMMLMMMMMCCAEIGLVRLDGSFPSFSDDDQYVVFNDGFTGVSAVKRDGSRKQVIYKVPFLVL